MANENIVLIMSDQHHKRAMSSAGHPIVKTPAMDKLASRGLSFSNAHCNFPLCGPSRAAFMTGRHPHENGVLTNDAEIPCDMPTFAHSFHVNGYETVLSGRMHFVGLDQRHGFEKRLIGDCPESSFIAAGWQLQQVLGDLVDTPGMSLTGLKKSGPGNSGYLDYDKAVTKATLDYLEERQQTKNDQPFLLVAGYAMPHCPFVCEPDDFYQYYDQVPLRDSREESLGEQHPFYQQLRKRWGSNPLPDAATMRRVETAYYGMVNHMDRQVGAIMDAIDNSDYADNTTIIYTSDHGEQLGEHGMWWKSTFMEGSIGVPLLVSTSDKKRTGQTSKANVSLMDIGPTLLDLVGIETTPGTTAASFRCVLDDDESQWSDAVFAENCFPSYFSSPQRMYKKGPWKYSYFHDMPAQLFNIDDDPNEEHNLANDPAQVDRIKEMNARVLENWDPHAQAETIKLRSEELRLIGQSQKLVMPPEPDPLWFDTVPENYIEDIT